MALLSFVDSLIAKSVSAVGAALARGSGGRLQNSNEAICRLHRSLLTFHTVVSRAGKTSEGREYVQLWNLEIKDLMYDIEDILDEIQYEWKKMVGGQAPIVGLKRKLSEVISYFNSRSLITRMSEKTSSLEKLVNSTLVHLSLETGGGEPELRNLVPTSSLLSGDKVFGRDEDKSKLINFLLSEASYSLAVIAVVGMAGIGKTMLAQLVLNDERVKDCFQTTAWIYVSPTFNVSKLTKNLIEVITRETCNLTSLECLQSYLHALVGYKRVVLVLDDVWNESHHLWEVFASPLRTACVKIIVTTQNESVAMIMQTVPPLKLKILPEDVCADIFKNHVFGTKLTPPDPGINQEMSVVGWENDVPEAVLLKAVISALKKFEGLPLAVKEFGCRFRQATRNNTLWTWHDVLTEDFNPAIEFTTGMFLSLRLSYELLPAHLKRCISYCSLFPEDYVYKKDCLAMLWVAQGFLQFESESIVGVGTREHLCRVYFCELVRRSFFLPLDSTTDLGGFKMHRLIHSLCKYVSGNEILSFQNSEPFPQFSKELRHLFVASDEPVVVPDYVRLRTFIYHSDPTSQFIPIPENLFLNLKYVRALELNISHMKVLPNSIGNLKYLKYLHLNCGIYLLPESIGNLYNLQMLNLSGCKRLRQLPETVENLNELWFLGLPPVELDEGVDTMQTTSSIPRLIGRLTSLRTLIGVILARDICEVRGLVNLRGEFSIAGLGALTSVKDAVVADIKSKKFLQILRLHWRKPSDYCSHDHEFGNKEYHVLENLKPHNNLRELVITGYGGDKIPSWLSDPAFSSMTKMTLFGCKGNKCQNLAALGLLPSLKCLYIGWMPCVRRVYDEFLFSRAIPRNTPFPSLVELSFEEMREWVCWSGVSQGDCPVLRNLTIRNCPCLITMPNFPSLAELTINGCFRLEDFIRKNAQYDQILRRKTQVHKLLELPLTNYVADNSLPSTSYAVEKDTHKISVKEFLPDDYYTNSEVDDSLICGREDDMNCILEFLLSDKSAGHNATLMSLVAPSGVGKTSIMRYVYNNYKVSEEFDTRIWVCVCGVLDEKTLMKQIIESVTQLSCIRADLSLLRKIVKEELTGKKFLLVLDGAENEIKSFWSSVMNVFNVGVKGSKVIVATSNDAVADAIGSEHRHCLGYLSANNCWLIFDRPNHNFPRLSQIYECLVEKCEGIPLCLNMIGRLCHKTYSERESLDLLESKSWETNELGGRILPALRVCYEFMPSYLRKCFGYCALFPKNHVFVKDHIVCLWMSQGFIDPGREEKLEVIGTQYFDELVSRSFLQVSPIHDVKDGKFLMHELVHDLAELMSQKQNECFRSEDCSENIAENVSHLALAPYEFKKAEFNVVTKGITNLKTFLVVNRFTSQLYNISSPIMNFEGLNDLLEKHIHMKTLDLSDTDMKELPESIGLLKSLQFLGINNTTVQHISPQICTLPKLQTLEARNCCYLVELPFNLKELASLRYLDTRKESGFVSFPRGISHLTNLRTLAAFSVGNDESHSSISELKNLRHLRGELQITRMENIRSGKAAREADLENKKSLEILVLHWCGGENGDETGLVSNEVLCSLRPSDNLREIVIRNYMGTRFPIWMELDCFMPKLVSITLDNCFNCDKFPYLGNLSSLKYLCAQKMHLVQTLGVPISGLSINPPKFKSLEVLRLSEMYGFEHLFNIADGDFPRFRSLSINRCPMLRKIPGFASLVELSLSCCNDLPDISELSSVEFLKIDRVEKLESLDLGDRLPILKKLEINNCRVLSSVKGFSNEASNVKTKFFRCPKLDVNNTRNNVYDQGQEELQVVTYASEDLERNSGEQSEGSDDDYY